MSGRTIIEKVLSRKAGRPARVGEIVTVEPDRVMSHDNTAFIIKKFFQTGRQRVWDRDKIVIVFDHCVPAVNPAHERNHTEARSFVEDQGLPNFFDAGVGVCHQVMMEQGFVRPGQLVLGADSHSTLYGAANAIGVAVNRTEMAGIWATGEIWLKVPPTIRVVLEGELPSGVYAKDIALWLLRQLRADGAAYRAIEFAGPGLERLEMSPRMTCNMAVELGAKAGVMPFDRIAESYLGGVGADAGGGGGVARPEDEPVTADPDAEYERVLTVDLDSLSPQVARPHTVDNVSDLSVVAGTAVHHAYLGSCTNGRLDDLQVAARILAGRRVHENVRLVVYPASTEVAEAARRANVLDTLATAGAEVMTASCGPCFGAVGATLGAGEVLISSSNRNFRGRMGSDEAEVYLASPAVVAASCLEGRITDPRSYL